MKINLNQADAATAKTTATKQEKYEKKMAKYLANKARKEQMEKDRRERKNPFEDMFMDMANKFCKSGKPYIVSDIIIVDGEVGYFGVCGYGSTGMNTTFRTFYGGFSEGCRLERCWDDFCDKQFFKKMLFQNGNIIGAFRTNNEEEALQALMNDLINKVA